MELKKNSASVNWLALQLLSRVAKTKPGNLHLKGANKNKNKARKSSFERPLLNRHENDAFPLKELRSKRQLKSLSRSLVNLPLTTRVIKSCFRCFDKGC